MIASIAIVIDGSICIGHHLFNATITFDSISVQIQMGEKICTVISCYAARQFFLLFAAATNFQRSSNLHKHTKQRNKQFQQWTILMKNFRCWMMEKGIFIERISWYRVWCLFSHIHRRWSFCGTANSTLFVIWPMRLILSVVNIFNTHAKKKFVHRE